MTRPLIDSFGRRITYLRLSVTDRCDLRCTYCMAEKMQFLPRKELLTLEELERLADSFIARGVDTVRVTGGEPLVRKGILQLFEALGRQRQAGRLKDLTLTTNATRLAEHAEALAACGVERINISLDTLDPDTYRRLTRGGDIARALAGIDAAQAAGLQVKLNVVALRDDNAADIPALVEWAHGNGLAVSLIETMPLGLTGTDRQDQYQPLDAIRAQLEQRWTLTGLALKTAGPSRYVRVRETGGTLGFITPLSENFCAGCNRLRVTCTGTLYGCLGRNQSVDLRTPLRNGDNIDDVLDAAIAEKPRAHDFRIGPAVPEVARHMSVTGG